MRNPETSVTYVIAAGGTGGHIFPGIALAREVVARRPGAAVVFAGSERGLERTLIPAAGFPLETVRAAGFAGKRRRAQAAALARLPLGILDSWRLLRRRRPRAVAGFGAYVSVPVLAAARMLGIPTLIHDANAMPGVANRFLSRFATRVAVSLPAANARLARPGVVTGTPVRPEFFAVPPLSSGAAKRRLLVFGGSQGAAPLNRAVCDAASALAAEGVSLVLQTGEKHLAGVERRLSQAGSASPSVRLEAFLPRLNEELGAADLVVARSGAMTVAELAAAGRPAILVPFASATHGHQRENARALASAGAAILMEEGDLTGERLSRVVLDLLGDPERLARMGAAARTLSRPEAARHLADLLFEAEAAGGRAR